MHVKRGDPKAFVVAGDTIHVDEHDDESGRTRLCVGDQSCQISRGGYTRFGDTKIDTFRVGIGGEVYIGIIHLGLLIEIR